MLSCLETIFQKEAFSMGEFEKPIKASVLEMVKPDKLKPSENELSKTIFKVTHSIKNIGTKTIFEIYIIKNLVFMSIPI